MMNNGQGLGNISRTVASSTIGIVQSGQWLGEELVLMAVPMIYSAIALTDVKVFRVSVSDF